MFGQLGFLSTPGGAGGDANSWTRPSEWPAMPATAANRIDILVAVTNDASNFAAVSATAVGGYTVDWGDGTVENVASGVQRDHTYDYADADLGPVTSRGYKTAAARIYPQAADPITAFDLGLKNATAGLAAYSNPWLDIQVNAPSATVMAYRGGVEARIAERINIIAIGAVTTLAGVFQNCSALRSITFPAGSLASVTTLATAFTGCYSLKAISFPAGSLSLVTTLLNAFNSSYSLQFISFPAGSLALVTTLANAFQFCYNLQTISFPAGSLTLLTTIAGAFGTCLALQSISFPAGALGSVSTTTGAFTSCSNLERIENCRIPVSFTLPCNLAAAQLDEIYTSLPTIVGQTITVTGNWGTAADTPTIATAKGWTVTG